MVTVEELVSTLERLDDQTEQYRFLEREAALLTEETIQHLKARAYELSFSDNARSMALSFNIIYASKVSGKPLYKALGLITQGNVFLRRGHYRKAIYRYDKAQQIALAVGSPIEAARSQIGKVGALMHLGEHQTALVIARQISEVLLAHHQLIPAARVFSNIGNCYNELEQYQEALDAYKKSLDLLEQLDPATAQQELSSGLYLSNVSMAYCNLGRYHEALHYALRACEMAEQAKLIADKAVFQLSAAICYNLMGQYNKALRMLHEACAIFDKTSLIPNLITGGYLICDCYLELGRYEAAVEQSKELIKRLESLGLYQTWQIMRLYHLQGRALLALREWQEARQALLQAQNIAEQLGASGFKQRTDLRLAELYLACREEGGVTQAETLLRELVQNQGDIRILPTAQLHLARLEMEQAGYNSARQLIESAIGHFQQQAIQSGLYQAYSQLAEICEVEGKLPEALSYLSQSIEQLEYLRTRLAAESRSTFLSPKESIYESAFILSLSLKKVPEAFDIIERVKSRALVDLIDNQLDVRVRIHSEKDRPIVEEVERLRLRHNDLSWQLTRLQGGNDLTYQLIRSASFTAERAQGPQHKVQQELTRQKLACERQLLELTERLQVNNALYAEDISLATTYRPFDHSILQPEEALIEYYVARGELHAFVATRREVKVVAHKLCQVQQLKELLSKFRLNLAIVMDNLSRRNQIKPEVFAFSMKQLIVNSKGIFQKLYAALFAPIKPYLTRYKQLRIVPHGPLHYLPFHALYNPTTRRYLLEDFEEISYLPSANVLRFCRERSRQGRGEGALVFGFSNRNELPATLEETTRIAAIMREWGACVAEVAEAASLERFRAEAGNKRVIHLATHGIYREDAPLFSSLLLAGGELTAHELFNMELNTSLFTLSCCNSGLGTIGGGDEVLGLSRSCLYAGASSLALSLWRVDDRASARLMQEFYCNMLEGQGKAMALRSAQLTLLTDPAYAHPYYWAPFILIGDNGQL